MSQQYQLRAQLKSLTLNDDSGVALFNPTNGATLYIVAPANKVFNFLKLTEFNINTIEQLLGFDSVTAERLILQLKNTLMLTNKV
jgi:hypothetical protein